MVASSAALTGKIFTPKPNSTSSSSPLASLNAKVPSQCWVCNVVDFMFLSYENPFYLLKTRLSKQT